MAGEELCYNAKLSEQAERYDEMKEFMKEVARLGNELSVEERNLLSVAYKNAVGARRASWRVISSVEDRKKIKGQPEHAELATQYRKKIEVELKGICDDILSLLSECLIPTASEAKQDFDALVFYHKMTGDYYRYISEFSSESEKKAPTDSAKLAYEEATKIASAELLPTHPIRLGLALNFSVFYYEILNDHQKACSMARQAFDDAIAELDAVSEDSYRDSTLIMHLLRDNLTLWQSDERDEAAAQAAAPAEEPKAEA